MNEWMNEWMNVEKIRKSGHVQCSSLFFFQPWEDLLSHFDSLVKSKLSYCLATLQHIPHIHSALYGNSASLEDQPMSPKGIVWCP